MKRKTLLALLIFAAFLLIALPQRSMAQFAFVKEAKIEMETLTLENNCTKRARFKISITMSGQGIANYYLSSYDNSLWQTAVKRMDFQAAGTKTDYYEVDNLGHPENRPAWAKLNVVAPNAIESKVDYRYGCHIKNVYPSESPSGMFRISISGFKANQRTNDKFLDEDGAKDEIYVRGDLREFDVKKNNTYTRTFRQSREIGDTSGDRVRTRGGSASCIAGCNGGFQDGDMFPNSTPWARHSPAVNGFPMNITIKRLIKGTNAIVLIPSIWESDLNRSAITYWERSGDAAFSAMNTEMARAISAGDTTLHNLVIRDAADRAFGSFRIAEPGDNDTDRPIGMQAADGIMTYQPTALALTYDAAEKIASTDSGHGKGVIAVTFVDSESLRGNYTMYVHVERVEG